MISCEHEKNIEVLLSSDLFYRITPFLKVYPYGSDYDNLEKYFIENYLLDYCESVTKIILRLICYYDSEVSLTESFDKSSLKKYEYTDFRNSGLDEISRVIKVVLFEGKTTMNIYIPSIDSLITLNSGFDATVFSKNENFIKEVKLYTESEKLFFLVRS